MDFGVDQLPLGNGRLAREYLPVTETRIRPATTADLPYLYEVALKTGNSGTDATGMYLNDSMLGEVFVGPYLALTIDTCFALVKNELPVGYGLCVLDTNRFQEESEVNWWPRLREKYREFNSRTESDWLIQEIFTPTPSPTSILKDFPSHGHIDLLADVQGLGWGKKMMHEMESALSAKGSPGFHLRVSTYNNRALQFYSSIGYIELLCRNDEVIVGKVLN